MDKKLLSIVIPAYNEASNLEKINQELQKLAATCPQYDFEIILVDDGSADDSINILKSLSQSYPNFFYLQLSRNFGHQNALRAGLDHAKGQAVISMDADLQHPPMVVPQMIALWEQGAQVVYSLRTYPKETKKSKILSSKYFYKIMNLISDVKLEEGSSDFRLLDRKALEALSSCTEHEIFFRGLVKWLGFRQETVAFEAAERYSGQSKYNFKKMIKFALTGITSFSTKPLYLATYLGFIFSGLSLLYIPYIIYAFATGSQISGWASLLITVVFFGGLQLIILGIIGIYLGKIFIQTKNRPSYLVADSHL
jgi:polyisoprenyl-phosphate glycosyltransferase